MAGGSVHTIVSVDRRDIPRRCLVCRLDSYRDVRVSPDGTRLALATQSDVWTYDVVRGTPSRLTTNPGRDREPAVDARRAANRLYIGEKGLSRAVLAAGRWHWKRPATVLTGTRDLLDLRASDWSTDGSQLLFSEVSRSIRSTGARSDGSTSSARLRPTWWCRAISATTGRPCLHAAAGWLTDRTGLVGTEVYIERYPELGQRMTISTGGGRHPAWSRDGRELFFIGADHRQMFAVPVQTGATLVAGRADVSVRVCHAGGYRGTTLRRRARGTVRDDPHWRDGRRKRRGVESDPDPELDR